MTIAETLNSIDDHEDSATQEIRALTDAVRSKTISQGELALRLMGLHERLGAICDAAARAKRRLRRGA